MFLSLTCVFGFIYFSAAQQNFTVQTTTGIVIGTLRNGTNNVLFKSYINIPYALPPIGSLRFKAPKPFKASSTSTFINTEDGPVICPQLGLSSSYSENCLILNVYTPTDANASVLYPVMVWIHGGAFVGGYSSIFQPDNFIAEKVILVTVNYRLGALGFLSLGDARAPGNAGLKDQVLALKWVKDEISKFGGDVSKTTLFGESAGSASVHHHILSSSSKGLFNRAIMQSGTATAGWAYLESGFIERATTFAESIGCANDTKIDFACLQNANIDDIVYNQNIASSIENTIRCTALSFIPVREVTIVNETAFQTASLAQLINSVSNPVSTIMGVNKDEGLLVIRQSDVFFSSFISNLKYFIPLDERIKLSDSKMKVRVDKLKSHYFTERRPPSLSNYQGFVSLYTDKLFAVSTFGAAESILQKNSSLSIFLYRFNYNGAYGSTFSDAYKLGISGVNHGDELGYLFFPINNQQTNEATNVSKRMIQLWTTFAKTGNPTDTTQLVWKKITSTDSSYLSITKDFVMSTSNFSEAVVVNLWNEISQVTSGSFSTQSAIPILVTSTVVAKLFSF